MRPRHQDVLLLSQAEELPARVQDGLVGQPYRFHSVSSVDEAVEACHKRGCSIALAEFSCAGGLPGLKDLRSRLPLNLPLLVLDCPEDKLDTLALEGMFHAQSNPMDLTLLKIALRNAADKAMLTEENLNLRNELRRSKSLIMKDDLTSAYNRRYFDSFLEEEIERSRRFSSPLSLIFMDLDDLKQVNSRYGHAMGSLALKEAAIRIIDTVRSIDKVIRYGGDEFCIILPETDWRGAQEVAERIRANFAKAEFLVEKTGGMPLTASFGIASFPEHASDKGEMVRKADEAMFKIKEQTKNGILVAQ